MAEAKKQQMFTLRTYYSLEDQRRYPAHSMLMMSKGEVARSFGEKGTNLIKRGIVMRAEDYVEGQHAPVAYWGEGTAPLSEEEDDLDVG